MADVPPPLRRLRSLQKHTNQIALTSKAKKMNSRLQKFREPVDAEPAILAHHAGEALVVIKFRDKDSALERQALVPRGISVAELQEEASSLFHYPPGRASEVTLSYPTEGIAAYDQDGEVGGYPLLRKTVQPGLNQGVCLNAARTHSSYLPHECKLEYIVTCVHPFYFPYCARVVVGCLLLRPRSRRCWSYRRIPTGAWRRRSGCRALCRGATAGCSSSRTERGTTFTARSGPRCVRARIQAAHRAGHREVYFIQKTPFRSLIWRFDP
jgi:hypothetical protein